MDVVFCKSSRALICTVSQQRVAKPARGQFNCSRSFFGLRFLERDALLVRAFAAAPPSRLLLLLGFVSPQQVEAAFAVRLGNKRLAWSFCLLCSFCWVFFRKKSSVEPEKGGKMKKEKRGWFKK